MLKYVRQKVASARALGALCEAAEVEAHRDGQAQPGAEHFILAALSMPDGRAARAFASLGATPAQLREAIARQYQEPLKALGLQGAYDPEPLTDADRSSLYRAAPSGQALVQALARHRNVGLTSDLVLVAAAEQSEGVLPRALAMLNLEPEHLRKAALAG